MAVTNVPLVSQWAEVQRMAFGFSIDLPIACQLFVKSFCSKAFIGLPWPTKYTGILVSCFANISLSLRNSDKDDIVTNPAKEVFKNSDLFIKYKVDFSTIYK